MYQYHEISYYLRSSFVCCGLTSVTLNMLMLLSVPYMNQESSWMNPAANSVHRPSGTVSTNNVICDVRVCSPRLV